MLIRFAAVAVACVALNSPVHTQSEPAAPFGITFGMPRSELEQLIGTFAEAEPGTLVATTVPRPHPDFEHYVFFVSPTNGVCGITAMGKSVQMNAFGDQLKEAFAKIDGQLTERYGKAQQYTDMVKPGSIWNEPEDWSMALSLAERVLSKVWNPPASSLSAIGLQATAESRNEGRLLLLYQSPTSRACMEDLEQAQSSVL